MNKCLYKFNNRFYLAGDGAHRDADGYFWIMGRIDDVLNVSGHRLGTMEVESSLVAHDRVRGLAAGHLDRDAGRARQMNWLGKFWCHVDEAVLCPLSLRQRFTAKREVVDQCLGSLIGLGSED